MGRLPLLTIVLLLAGCGTGEECYPSGQLGSCCHDDGDCGEFSCFADLPGGLCSRDCSADHLCPEGSTCLLYQASDASHVLCLPGCASGQAPCRDGYDCRLPDGQSSPVCVPVR
ncbi:MAG: hypothetical protein DRI34_09180 [Deltaproteobacteria bacterium]|nr:MAG: hypothetical protein DRI34_09180 [Deltaproteobacteria bacterium]